ACRAANDYPVPLDRLLERVEPRPNPEEAAKALARKEFTSRAVVTMKGRSDAPVAFLEDGDRLAESPLVLEAALRKLGESSEPPWTIAKLAGALPTALRPWTRVSLADQIASGRLPPFAVTVKKGSAVRLYHRDRPPPPPPLPREVVLAERLIE